MSVIGVSWLLLIKLVHFGFYEIIAVGQGGQLQGSHVGSRAAGREDDTLERLAVYALALQILHTDIDSNPLLFTQIEHGDGGLVGSAIYHIHIPRTGKYLLESHTVGLVSQLLVTEGIDEDYFQRILRANFGTAIKALNSFESIAVSMAEGCFNHYDPYRFPEMYDAITQQDLLDFIGQNITAERMAISIIDPKEEQQDESND